MKWTRERVNSLEKKDIRQLRANALAQGAHEIVSLCDEVLGPQPEASGGTKTRKRQNELDGRPLVSRTKAFAMRGVTLRNNRWSWGGIRATDGAVVFTLWAIEIQIDGENCRYMLWGPNRGVARPWSDTPGGKERLRQCQDAEARGEAEGILIYGEQRGRDLPTEVASKVSGADPHTVLRFRVVREGDEYWAIWSGRPPSI